MLAESRATRGRSEHLVQDWPQKDQTKSTPGLSLDRRLGGGFRTTHSLSLIGHWSYAMKSVKVLLCVGFLLPSGVALAGEGQYTLTNLGIP